MSAPSDDGHEMLDDTLTDAAIEAFFVGLPESPWEHEASLATLADDVAVVMDASAPAADHALLQLFWGTPAVAEPSPTAVPVGAFRGRLRLIAGAALGTVLALSGVGVAGAAGALPAPVQRVVAGVVEAVSPFELPHPDGDSPPGLSEGGAVTTGDGTGGQAPTAGDRPAVGTSGSSSDDPQAVPPTPPPSPGPPGGPGSSGLDRAGQTPAGQWIPPFVSRPGAPPDPSPARSGSAPASGLDTARQTPAAGARASVPGPPTAGAPAHRP